MEDRARSPALVELSLTGSPRHVILGASPLHDDRTDHEEHASDSSTPLKGHGEHASLLRQDGQQQMADDNDDVELEEFEGVQLVPPSWPRRAAGYILKRPHVVVLAVLAVVFILPLLVAIFGTKSKFLECVDEEIPNPQQLLANMTLREKIGQMVVADLDDVGPGADIAKYHLGAVAAMPGGTALQGSLPHDWIKTSSSLQAHALTTRLRIPILFGADAIHGHGGAYGATIFPHQIGLGATHNTALAQVIGLAVARELRATGVRWAFGPSLSVCRDPRWGRCYETFSENERLTRMMGTLQDGLAGQEETSAWASIEKNELVST